MSITQGHTYDVAQLTVELCVWQTKHKQNAVTEGKNEAG